MANNKKRNHHTGAKVTAATAVLLAALAGGSFGFRHGGWNIPGIQNNEKKGFSVEEKSVAEQAPSQNDDLMTITVRNSSFFYQGNEVTLSELESLLLSNYTAEKQIILQDDHAIKSAFDELTALLAKLSMPYTAE